MKKTASPTAQINVPSGSSTAQRDAEGSGQLQTAQRAIAMPGIASPADLLTLQRMAGNRAVQGLLQRAVQAKQSDRGAGAVVQRYQEFGAKNSRSNWLNKLAPEMSMRVAEDGTIAVAQADHAGSHYLYADQSRVEEANELLGAASSPVELSLGQATVTGPVPTNRSEDRTLKQVIPEYVKEDGNGLGKGSGFKLISDCGDAARTISGTDDLHARFHPKGRPNDYISTESQDPELMKAEINKHHFMRQDGKVKETWDEYKSKVSTNVRSSTKKQKDTSVYEEFFQEPYLDEINHDKDPAAKKEELDERMGINRYANPEIGSAYVISTGGEQLDSNSGKEDWNFHWGAVIMKSEGGEDNVTMENYATAQKEVNAGWSFQMYGVPTNPQEQKGKTFHEEHRDKHRQHGTTPTTMDASRKIE